MPVVLQSASHDCRAKQTSTHDDTPPHPASTSMLCSTHDLPLSSCRLGHSIQQLQVHIRHQANSHSRSHTAAATPVLLASSHSCTLGTCCHTVWCNTLQGVTHSTNADNVCAMSIQPITAPCCMQECHTQQRHHRLSVLICKHAWVLTPQQQKLWRDSIAIKTHMACPGTFRCCCLQPFAQLQCSAANRYRAALLHDAATMS